MTIIEVSLHVSHSEIMVVESEITSTAINSIYGILRGPTGRRTNKIKCTNENTSRDPLKWALCGKRWLFVSSQQNN